MNERGSEQEQEAPVLVVNAGLASAAALSGPESED